MCKIGNQDHLVSSSGKDAQSPICPCVSLRQAATNFSMAGLCPSTLSAMPMIPSIHATLQPGNTCSSTSTNGQERNGCALLRGEPLFGVGETKRKRSILKVLYSKTCRNKWSLLSVRVADTKKQPGPSAASMFSSASNMVALTRSLRMEAKSQGASQRGSTSTFSAPPWREKVANS